MKTSEPKTATVAKSTKANQPFFSKDGEGSFFGESVNRESPFFKPSSAYRVNSNGVLQTKLTIGQPNDKYEKEADAMADKVVQRLANPEPLTKKESSIQAKPLTQTIAPIVQTKCAACEPASAKASAGKEEKLQKKEEEDLDQESPLELQRKPIFESNAEPPDDNSLSKGEAVQRKCADCESASAKASAGKKEKLQRKSDSLGESTASSDIESSLNASKGSGLPIPESTKQQMENSFGADFSNVRLHTESSTVQMNKDLHAQAFTHGSDIYFNAGKCDTNSTGGKHLLAHELTHVVQQGTAIKAIQKQPTPTDHLTSLNEMLDRFDVPEQEVIDLLRQLTPNEKTTINSDVTYRIKMAAAFDVSEMVSAVIILNPTLIQKLEWVEAAAGSASSIDYPEISFLIISSSQPERDTLKTVRWRNFFINVCDNNTIITAVTDLHFDLKTQLEWIEEEASPSNIDYSQIQPLITAATQPDRDLLKTNHWRDFFVGVCNNTTIKNALNDLNFDLLTTILWLIEEVAISSIDFVWLCNRFRAVNVFPAGEDTIACAIMERDIRDAVFDTSGEHRPPGWITRAHSQKLVADQMAGMVGQQGTWTPSWQNSATTFAQWARNTPQGPTPALGAMLVINCWEMIMLAAFRAGVLTWARIHSIYTAPGGPAWGSFLVNQLSFNNRIPYNVGAPVSRPVVGDIVFFDGPAHVALAKGTLDGMGRTQIFSFWPPPNTAFTAGGTLDDVKITTIEELNDYWVAAGRPAFGVEYTTPNW